MEITLFDESISVPVYFMDRSHEGFEKIISNMCTENEISWEGLSVYELRIVQGNLEYFNNYQLRKVMTYIELASIGIEFASGLYAMIPVALEDERVFVGHSHGQTTYIDVDSRGEDNCVLSGHTDDVNCLVLLPDGRFCSRSDDNSIKIWNKSTCHREKTLNGHTSGVYSLCALSDTRICSGSLDNKIKIWNIQTGACEKTLIGHAYCVESIVYLADGRICSGSADDSIKIWNLQFGICEVTLTGHTSGVCVVIQLRDCRICSEYHLGLEYT